MMNKKQITIALLIWFLGLPLSIAISYILRKTGDFNSLGMPEIIWFTMHLSIYMLSIVFIYASLKKFTIFKKLVSIVVISCVFAAYYIGITWFYIIGSGIDSV